MSSLAWFSAATEHAALRKQAVKRAERGARLVGNWKIEKNIPIPPPHGRGGFPVKGYSAVLRLLERGDSVALPVGQQYAAALASRVLGSGTFATRAEGAGTRIWRIK